MLNSANSVTRTVTDYGEDPIQPARGLVHDAWMRLHGFLVPAVVGGDTDPGLQFFGYGPELQSFHGAANRASTAVTYRDGSNAELTNAESGGVTTDPVRRIFGDRLRRRSPM